MKRIELRIPAACVAAGMGLATLLAASGCNSVGSSTAVTPAEQANWKGAPMPAAFAAKLAEAQRAKAAKAAESAAQKPK